jgi:hypothetical protein
MQKSNGIPADHRRDPETGGAQEERGKDHAVGQQFVFQVDHRENEKYPEKQCIDDGLEMQAELPCREPKQHRRSELHQRIAETDALTAPATALPGEARERKALHETARGMALRTAVPAMEDRFSSGDLNDGDGGQPPTE